jgi:hypothetical protein
MSHVAMDSMAASSGLFAPGLQALTHLCVDDSGFDRLVLPL